MSLKLRAHPGMAGRGWAARLLGGGARRPDAGADAAPGGEAAGGLVEQLIADGREAFVLLPSTGEHVTDDEAEGAREALGRRMALIPAGRLVVTRADGAEELAEVAAFYLDRTAVTNRLYERFVAAGCYDALELWPREIWPSLLQFTDRTGRPGPAGWTGGTYPAGKADHPVVGVCWYEAAAYARWVGKRLPTAIEWQKAGGWPEHLGGGACTRYPWGDLFDPKRANLWAAGLGDTATVDAFPGGDTPNGLRQLTGNVWEWLDDPLDAIPGFARDEFCPWKPLRRIAGGAFDTYMAAEATCHFVTGQGELDRRDNIGFRCALSADRLRQASAP